MEILSETEISELLVTNTQFAMLFRVIGPDSWTYKVLEMNLEEKSWDFLLKKLSEARGRRAKQNAIISYYINRL